MYSKESNMRSKDAYMHSKKPNIHSQETSVHSKEAYLHSKEAYIHSKDAYIHSKKASTSMIHVKVGLSCLMFIMSDVKVVDVGLLHYRSCHHTLRWANSLVKKSCCAPRRALLHCILLTRGIIFAPA